MINQDAIRKVSGRHGEPPPCDKHPNRPARYTHLGTGASECQECVDKRIKTTKCTLCERRVL